MSSTEEEFLYNINRITPSKVRFAEEIRPSTETQIMLDYHHQPKMQHRQQTRKHQLRINTVTQSMSPCQLSSRNRYCQAL